MRNLVLDPFKLKLRVPFNSAPSCINKCSRVTKIILKKSFKLSPKKRFYLALIFILVLAETDLPIKKKIGKQGKI